MPVLGMIGRGVPAPGVRPAGTTTTGMPTRPRAAGDPLFRTSRRALRPNWREPCTSPCQVRIYVQKSPHPAAAAAVAAPPTASLQRPSLFPRAAPSAPSVPPQRSAAAFRLSSASSSDGPSRAAWGQWGQVQQRRALEAARAKAAAQHPHSHVSPYAYSGPGAPSSVNPWPMSNL